MRSRAFLALAVLLVAGPPSARAWSGGPHELICEIAWHHLSPAGRQLVGEVRQEGGDTFPTFSASCNWPDTVRKGNGPHLSTYEYHFINVQDDAAALDFGRDCRALDCAPVAIMRFATYLATSPNGSRERERRLWALRFLGHFVGDLHQPLHAGERGNAGGNFLTVEWFGRERKLHAVWDGEIPGRANLDDSRRGKEIEEALDEQDAAAWSNFDVVGWASDSYQLAYRYAYRYENLSRVQPGDELEDEYFRRAKGVVEEQIEKAGVRLAHLINSAADGTLSFPAVHIGPAPTP